MLTDDFIVLREYIVPMFLISLEMGQLSELERKFYLLAVGCNIPQGDIAKLISWQREGVVDLNSFFQVENRPIYRLTRTDYFRLALTNMRAACRWKLPLGWK